MCDLKAVELSDDWLVVIILIPRVFSNAQMCV